MVRSQSVKIASATALMIFSCILSGCSGSGESKATNPVSEGTVAPVKDATDEKEAQQYALKFLENQEQQANFAISGAYPDPNVTGWVTVGGKPASEKTKKAIFEAIDAKFHSRTQGEYGRAVLNYTCHRQLYDQSGNPNELFNSSREMALHGDAPLYGAGFGNSPSMGSIQMPALEAISAAENGDWASVMVRAADPILRSEVPGPEDVHVFFYVKEEGTWKECSF